MLNRKLTRRDALQGVAACAGAALLTNVGGRAQGFTFSNDRPRVAAIGTGSRWAVKATGASRNR